jgi:hypothetical protein
MMKQFVFWMEQLYTGGWSIHIATGARKAINKQIRIDLSQEFARNSCLSLLNALPRCELLDYDDW